jgi:hypothetical protein
MRGLRRTYIAKVSSSCAISNFEARNGTSNFLDNTYAFVTESNAVLFEQSISVAETAVGNFQENIVRTKRWDLDRCCKAVAKLQQEHAGDLKSRKQLKGVRLRKPKQSSISKVRRNSNTTWRIIKL